MRTELKEISADDRHQNLSVAAKNRRCCFVYAASCVCARAAVLTLGLPVEKEVKKAAEGQAKAGKKAVEGQRQAVKKAVEGLEKAVKNAVEGLGKAVKKKAVEGQGKAVKKAVEGQTKAVCSPPGCRSGSPPIC